VRFVERNAFNSDFSKHALFDRSVRRRVSVDAIAVRRASSTDVARDCPL
jgi:hypothetical protein